MNTSIITNIQKAMSQYGVFKSEHIEYLNNKCACTENTGKEITKHLSMHSSEIEYRDQAGNPTKEKSAAQYKWVPLPLHYNDRTLYVAFRKAQSGDFVSYFVSNYELLEQRLFDYLSGNTEAAQKFAQHKSVCSEIYNMLINKEPWEQSNVDSSLGVLLKVLEHRIEAENYPEAWCQRSDEYLVYNTGLINIYGTDVIIMKNTKTEERSLVRSKTDLLNAGLEPRFPDPVRFYSDASELIFPAEHAEFDLSDVEHMHHIYNERKDRLESAGLGDLTPDEFAAQMRTSIENGIKMAARNPYWAAPFYNIKNNEIQFMLPFYGKGFTSGPSLAMIVRKGYFYEVCTMLPLSSAYSNAVCLVSPPAEWLKDSKEREDA